MRKETRTCQMSMMYEITIKPKKYKWGRRRVVKSLHVVRIAFKHSWSSFGEHACVGISCHVD